jgi:3-dehydroquinate dehydratase I
MSPLIIKNHAFNKGMPKIIIPIAAENEEQLAEEMGHITLLHPDIIEWRADYYEQVEDVNKVKTALRKLDDLNDNKSLLLFTFRRAEEGGNKPISTSYYIELLQTAMESQRIDLLDVELFAGEDTVQTLIQEAKKKGVHVILSNHDFHHTPSKNEIIRRLEKMIMLGADIPKIAVMPNDLRDVLTLLDATQEIKKIYPDIPFITMAMGKLGIISRIAGECFGSAATFGIGKKASAPGQLPVDDLRKVLEIIHRNYK